MSKGRPVAAVLHDLPITPQPVVPVTPESLGEAGAALWVDIFRAAVWLNMALDGYLVEQACLLADDMAQARAEIVSSGRYQTIPNGSTIRAAAVVDLERLAIQQNSYLAALGLTPSDRARLGVQSAAVYDPFKELERRREERRLQAVSADE